MKTERANPSTKPCWLFHKWLLVGSTGLSEYHECSKCYSRHVRQPDTGYQPVDWGWLNHEKITLGLYYVCGFERGGTTSENSE